MTRHSRPRSGVCPIGAAFLLAGILFGSSAIAGIPLTPVQQLAAARGAEALDAAVGVSRGYSLAFDPNAMALLVVQPGRWAVLMNHPQPPSGFAAADPFARRRPEAEASAAEDVGGNPPGDTAQNDETKPSDLPPWSVHLTTATAPFEDLPHPWLTLEGRPTGVVRFNDVSVATGNAAGWPPAEAVVIHMVRALWQAHRAAVEPPRALDDMPWLYRAGPEDLALAAIEQRQILATSRLVFNEHTQDQYRKLLMTWLAVRKLRFQQNPAAVAMEEAIEVREGIADFIQTAPFRVAENPGAEERAQVERLDPFFLRYRNFAMLRVNILNYPLHWYPANPADGLVQARARGALLSFVVWPVLRRWNETYFPAGGGMPRPWRELLEPALHKDGPADPNAEAALVEEAKATERYDLLVSVIRASMDETAGDASRAGAESPPELRLDLEGRRLTSWEAGQRWTWRGPGRVEVAGPLVLRFEGGEVRLGSGRSAIFVASGGSGGLAEVRLVPPAGSQMTVGQKTLPWPSGGRKPVSLQGDGHILAPGMELSFRGASVRLGAAEGVLAWSAGK
jgi:hypothetical protein